MAKKGVTPPVATPGEGAAAEPEKQAPTEELISKKDYEESMATLVAKHKEDISKLTSSLQRDTARKAKETEDRVRREFLGQMSTDPAQQEKLRDYYVQRGYEADREKWMNTALDGTGLSINDPRLDRTGDMEFALSVKNAVVEDAQKSIEDARSSLVAEAKKIREQLEAELKVSVQEARSKAGLDDVETSQLKAPPGADKTAEVEKWYQTEMDKLRNTGNLIAFTDIKREYEKRLAEATKE